MVLLRVVVVFGAMTALAGCGRNAGGDYPLSFEERQLRLQQFQAIQAANPPPQPYQPQPYVMRPAPLAPNAYRQTNCMRIGQNISCNSF